MRCRDMNKWLDFVRTDKKEGMKKLASPTFKLSSRDRIFTIGSCFARNIEDYLSGKFSFPVMDYMHHDNEYNGERPRGVLNKFTPICMLSELEWLLDIEKRGESFYDATGRSQ